MVRNKKNRHRAETLRESAKHTRKQVLEELYKDSTGPEKKTKEYGYDRRKKSFQTTDPKVEVYAKTFKELLDGILPKTVDDLAIAYEYLMWEKMTQQQTDFYYKEHNLAFAEIISSKGTPRNVKFALIQGIDFDDMGLYIGKKDKTAENRFTRLYNIGFLRYLKRPKHQKVIYAIGVWDYYPKEIPNRKGKASFIRWEPRVQYFFEMKKYQEQIRNKVQLSDDLPRLKGGKLDLDTKK